MKGTLLRGIVRPLIERLGTMLAAYMIARGFDSDLTAQLSNALVVVFGIVYDLVVSQVNRDRDITRFINEASRYDNVYSLRRGDD